MKKLLLSFFCSLPAIALAATGPALFPPPAHAQELNYQCVGNGLANYMNEVIKGTSGLSNIRLLTPAFNMTSFTFQSIVGAMDNGGANWAGIYGLAGNIYNVDGRGITSWLDEKKAQLPSGLKSKPIILTETGEKDVVDKPNLGRELNSALDKGVQAALLFNAFNTNKQFAVFSFPSDADIRRDICGLSCGRIGVNYAEPFSTDPAYYSRAVGLGMNYQLAISTTGSIENIKAALSSGTNLVIRIGNMESGGGFDKPGDYVNFLKQVNTEAAKARVTVYAIAGPNEPDTEFWATPQCKASQLPAKKGPLEEGFNPQNSNLNCDQTTPSEYHPLRPYPGNPCDPLIPKSIPEAPVTSEKKFNTFACGTSLTPSALEQFDPYGDNRYPYEAKSTDQYAHTWCEPRPDQLESGGTVTCWRSEAFDVTLDLSKANLGILGNTQDNSLTDAQKVNEYLSWYLTGTPQIGDQIPLSAKNPADINRLVNFSGPLRKLLPFDLVATARDTVISARDEDVHNYMVGCNQIININPEDYLNAIKQLLTSGFGNVFDIAQIATKIVEVDIKNLPAFGKALSKAVGQPNFEDKFKTFFIELGGDEGVRDRAFNSAKFIVSRIGNMAKNVGDAIAAVQPLTPDRAVVCADANIATAKARLSDYDGLKGWLGNLIKTDAFVKLLQNIPFSSLEDTAGEVTVSVFRDPTAEQQTQNITNPVSNNYGKSTAPLKLIIKKAELAK